MGKILEILKNHLFLDKMSWQKYAKQVKYEKAVPTNNWKDSINLMIILH